MTAVRVLFADHAAVLGGAELSLLDIATAFRDRGAVALFEDGPFARALVANDVRVIPIAAGRALRSVKKGSGLPGPSALVATLRASLGLALVARSFDVLYANSPKSFLVGTVAAVVARRPLIWHLRDILDTEHFSAGNVRLLIRAANLRAALVVANSHATADAFVAAGGRRALVRVVHNGIDAAPFDALPVSARDDVRRDLGIGPEVFLVGSFSRLHPWKGQLTLFSALEHLPGVHALVVGGALFSGEQEYAASLAAMASSGGLRGRVHMLGARDDVPRLMAACDAIVHTSVFPEPFGRVLVEALLARRPLVASDGGGVREVVRDGETALVVPRGSVDQLADAIATLRSDPALAATLASAGSSDVRTRFTRKAMLDGVARAIGDVAKGAGR